MRQRKVKNLDEKLQAASAYTVDTPEEMKGRWHEAFGRSGDLYLELGCGKGQFISTHAVKNPECNFVAIEGQDCVAIRAMEKAQMLDEVHGLRNLKVVCKFANDIGEMFADGELSGIYLNFSDPWPKARHNKRRLTYRGRLLSYMKALKEGGFIEIMTDNDSLFAFTLEEIEALGLERAAYSDDLHADGLAAAEVTTEYEDKFKGQGLPIHYVRIEKAASDV